MYRVCPKCGHDGGSDARVDCPACGLVYAKWMRRRYAAAVPATPSPRSAAPGLPAALAALLLPESEPARYNPVVFAGRALVWVGLVIWGLWFIQVDIRSLGIEPGFMHLVNLPFHEVGHLLFRPFGHVMMYLGGSLFQVLVPFAIAVTFLLRYGNPFGAAVALWWTGQSLQDVAPYIADATRMELTLLGGGTGWEQPGMHDWQQILADFNRLEWDQPLAHGVNAAGIAVMVAALGWAALLLGRDWRAQAT